MLEHANYSFALRNVSRVFTHELVRHRAGSAFSQESLRYVRLTDIGFRVPPALAPLRDRALAIVETLEEFQREAAASLDLDAEGVPFHVKKEVTSALRRLAPIGLSTDIIWTANLRTLRHVVEMRTAEGAEEELRLVFDEVARVMHTRPRTRSRTSSATPTAPGARASARSGRSRRGVRGARRAGAALGADTRMSWRSRRPAAPLVLSDRRDRLAEAAMTSGSRRVVTSPRARPSAMSRSRRRMILPERVFGSSSAQTIALGPGELADLLGDRRADAVLEPGVPSTEPWSVTNAQIAWPVCSSNWPMTAASATASWATIADSTSAVESRWPETLTTSSMRPITQM